MPSCARRSRRSALLILTAFGYGVLRRYVGSLAAAEQSAHTLDLQLAERTRELETEADGQGVSVRIVDDGRGFDVDRQLDSGRGLRNMMRRAQALGGSVTVVSRPGQTVLTLRLPRERAGGPAAATYNRPGQESSP